MSFKPFSIGDAYNEGAVAAINTTKARTLADDYRNNKTSEELAKTSLNDQGEYSAETHAKALEKRGLIKQAGQVRMLDLQVKTGQLNNEATKLKSASKAIEVMKQSVILSHSRGGKGWDGVVKFAKKYEIPGVPEQYDPKFAGQIATTVESLQKQVLKYKIASQQKKMQFQQELSQASQSGDPKQIKAVMAKYPLLAQQLQKGSASFGQPKVAINPKTGKHEYAQFDKSGRAIFTGVEAPGKGVGTISTPWGDIKIGEQQPTTAQPMTGTNQTKQQQEVIKHQAALDHLEEIDQRLKGHEKDYLTLVGKWRLTKLAAKDFVTGLDPNSEGYKKLYKYSQFLGAAAQNFALTLKDVSGVAVNPTEFKRSEAWLPNAGTGLTPAALFGGEGPAKFRGKLNRLIQFRKRLLIRAKFAAANGITMSRPLDQPVTMKWEHGAFKGGEYKKTSELTPEGLAFTKKYSLAHKFGGTATTNRMINDWVQLETQKVLKAYKDQGKDISYKEAGNIGYNRVKGQLKGLWP